MVINQHKSKRKVSGSRYIKSEKKRLAQRGNIPTLTRLLDRKLRKRRTKGGNLKLGLIQENTANVFDKKNNKYIKTKILNITENPANRNFIRRNIITKGTIMETEAGKAVVTSRPGSEGTINAVLVE